LPQNERRERAVEDEGAALSCVEVDVDAIDASSTGGEGIEVVFDTGNGCL
jgi:hypothetical protein